MNIEERHARGRAQYGDKYDPSSIDAAPQFHPYYGTGTRIRVRFGELELTGTVTSTTGWRPALLLLLRSNSHGSVWTLGPEDELVGVKLGRRYIPITARRQAT